MDTVYTAPRRPAAQSSWSPASLWAASAFLSFIALWGSAKLNPAIFSPIPMTLQTFIVLSIGFAASGSSPTRNPLRSALLATSLTIPYALVASRLSLFSATDPVYSWGYLAGFVPMAGIVAFGWSLRSNNRWLNFGLGVVLALLGSGVLYALGLPVLHKALLAVNSEQTWAMTQTVGLDKFVLGDLIKIGLATALAAGLTLQRS